MIFLILLIGEEHAKNLNKILNSFNTFIGRNYTGITPPNPFPDTPPNPNTEYVDITNIKFISP